MSVRTLSWSRRGGGLSSAKTATRTDTLDYQIPFGSLISAIGRMSTSGPGRKGSPGCTGVFLLLLIAEDYVVVVIPIYWDHSAKLDDFLD